MFEESDAAILGNVKKKLFDFSFSKDKYLIEVKQTKQGETKREITVWTKSKCRAHFAINEDYVIFMNRDNGKLWTDINMIWRVYEKTRKLTDQFIKYRGVRK